MGPGRAKTTLLADVALVGQVQTGLFLSMRTSSGSLTVPPWLNISDVARRPLSTPKLTTCSRSETDLFRRPTATAFRLDVTASRWRKVAFRSHWTASVQPGNHSVYRWGRRETSLRIAYLPWRSFEQMQRKVTQGTIATLAAGLKGSVNGHWKTMRSCRRRTSSSAGGTSLRESQRKAWCGVRSARLSTWRRSPGPSGDPNGIVHSSEGDAMGDR